MDVVKIRGLEVSARHGVNDFEKVAQQKFIFDADIATDFYRAAVNDDLSATVNYSAASKLIVRVATEHCFNLIEKLAYECAFSLMENFKNVSSVSLTVYKPDAPMKLTFSSVAVTANVERETVYLSLGSSLGDKKHMLDTAFEMLSSTRGIKVEKVSDYIETPPYGGVAQNGFLNCAARISTFLSPYALLDELHRIENACGRVRQKRWDDRTLDIDIIFFGDKTINGETLTIPHPDYKNRDFVLKPLKQIAPHLFRD